MIDRKALYLTLLGLTAIVFAAFLTYLVYKIWRYLYMKRHVDSDSEDIDIVPNKQYYPYNVPISYFPVAAQDPIEEVPEEEEEEQPKPRKLRNYNLLKNVKKATPFEPVIPRTHESKLIRHDISKSCGDLTLYTKSRSIEESDGDDGFHRIKLKTGDEMKKPFRMQKSRRVIDLRGNSLNEEMFFNVIKSSNSEEVLNYESLSSSCDSLLDDSDSGIESKKAGKIRFTTRYCEIDRKLQVRVIKAFDIAPDREMYEIKPFVRVSLYPGKKQSQNTKSKKEPTKEPFFNEIIVFQALTLHDICTHKIKVKVCNRIRVGKKEILGEVDLNLSNIDQNNKEKEFTLPLCQIQRAIPMATISVSVNHEFVDNKLSVTIHEARIPKTGKYLKQIDPYVTIEFYKEEILVEKKKTETKKKAMDPWIYNENFQFPVSLEDPVELEKYSLLITLRHNMLVTNKTKTLGQVLLSVNSPVPSAKQQWEKVVEVPDVCRKVIHSLAGHNG